jgi:hypothetical protein
VSFVADGASGRDRQLPGVRVPMVEVRNVGVRVDHRLVAVTVGVADALRRIVVLMVSVVLMFVFVLDRGMAVFVLMA